MHFDEEVKQIFGNDKVFLCFFPPNMTNFIQPIDAGLGRSVRIKIGYFLDAWLMVAENLQIWETKMTAGERRILVTDFVGNKVTQDVMSPAYEGMRIGRFERAGCLITLLSNNFHDQKIHLQVLKSGSFTVPSEVRAMTVVEQAELEGQHE